MSFWEFMGETVVILILVFAGGFALGELTFYLERKIGRNK